MSGSIEKLEHFVRLQTEQQNVKLFQKLDKI